MRDCPTTWHPERGGHLPIIRWEDSRDVEIGDGRRFDEIADLMMSGLYYPPEIIKFIGEFQDEGRPIRKGDRIMQRMTFGPFRTWTMVEIWVAERSENECLIGYVTTACHHGRGMWEARLTREAGRLRLRLKATSGPQSILFWLGLPIARGIQMYTWKAAIERLRGMASS